MHRLLLIIGVSLAALLSCETPNDVDVTEEPIRVARFDPGPEFGEQATCGNGNCTLRTDKLGRDYCTCKGRQGRAIMECCGE